MADIATLRTTLRNAQAAVAEALYQKSVAANAASEATLANAHQASSAARSALNAALAAALPPGSDPAATLNGELPVVLFPLRLETRYVRASSVSAGGVRVADIPRLTGAPTRLSTVGSLGSTETRTAPSTTPAGILQIRIYPNEILAQTHEPELTDDEWQAGLAYWAAGDSLPSWAALSARFPAPRAAWIVAETNTSTRPPARAASWTRPATAVLPDRFAAFAYRGGALVASTVGAPVVEPMTLTLSPTIDDVQRLAIPGSTLQIDADLLWTVQFAEAKAVGMALELSLSAIDWSQGFDLLVVVGTKGTFSASEATEHIQSLLDGHHFTRGLALVPPGTQTSNLPGALSGYPMTDSGGSASFAIERGTPASGDGLLLADAIGVNPEVVAHIDQTGLKADAAAQAMLTALWPATLGYHLEEMMAPAETNLTPPFNATAIDAAYEYTRTYVRPGGPLPSLRVGSVPYGILPASSLTRLAAAKPGVLATALSALRGALLRASDKAPRVDPASSDPDGDLLNVLRLNASSSSFLVQVLIGSQFQLLIGQLPGMNGSGTAAFHAGQGGIATSLLRSLSLPASNPPRIALSSFGVPETFAGVLVSSLAQRDKPLPDSANYVKWILDQWNSGGTALETDMLPPAYERTLLYQLLRHAVLVEKGRIARPGIREVEVLGLRLAASAAAPIATASASTVSHSASPPTPPPPPPVSHRADVAAALETVAGLSIADLERLFCETLDLCSHRFDAWITSLATARLKELRGPVSAGGKVSVGSHYGAYGWVQNLKPRADPFDSGPGGFIHAPSSSHARAAAILRNGFLARGATGTNIYALDLSSARVRAGLVVLARIRDGESLSEILGTELETRLREDPAVAATFLQTLRTNFPTPSSPIVDGLAAVLAWRATPTSPHFPSAILTEVSQLLDATADLLTAESVFQTVCGNPSGAAAALDALGQGARPPDPQIAHAPIAGIALSHRVAVLLDDSEPSGWTSALTPRAQTSRYLDGWLGQLFCDPQRVKCRLRTASGVQIVTLAQLGLRPIDVVVLSEAPLDENSEIDARIRSQSSDPAATVNYLADPTLGTDAVTFPALLELARTLDRLLSLARPMVASDLALATDAISDAADPDIAARAQRVLAALAALDLSTPGTLRDQLRQAALFGFGGAYVAGDATTAELSAIAQRVDAERQTRLREANAAAPDPAGVIRCIFARSFPLIGSFALPTALPSAFAMPQGLSAQDVERWIHKATRVRPGLERWRRSRLLAQALGAPPPNWHVVQLPFSPTARWCSLPFSDGGAPSSGTVSVVILHPGTQLPSGNWAGLILDEWTELVPSAVQQTATAFNYPSPRAEAPQAILLAVPPVAAAAWSTQVLADIVRETFELARIRLLTPQILAAYSLLLPATSLSVNSGGDTLSTNLWTSVIAPIQVVAVAGS